MFDGRKTTARNPSQVAMRLCAARHDSEPTSEMPDTLGRRINGVLQQRRNARDHMYAGTPRNEDVELEDHLVPCLWGDEHRPVIRHRDYRSVPSCDQCCNNATGAAEHWLAWYRTVAPDHGPESSHNATGTTVRPRSSSCPQFRGEIEMTAPGRIVCTTSAARDGAGCRNSTVVITRSTS